MKWQNVLVGLCLLKWSVFGSPALDERIVGGESASIEEVPYQLSLRLRGRHVCGAAIINENVVITAAHCVESVEPSQLSIYTGSSTKDNDGVLKGVFATVMHKKYNSHTSDNDIALIKLSTALQYNYKTVPISLPEQNEVVPVGTQGVVSGWGYLQEEGRVSRELRKVVVPVISNKQCQYNYMTKASITPRMLCAGFEEGGRDACQGDSGGPLVANGKLIGIVSFGIGCARAGYPGVYTRVAKYRNWIDKNASTWMPKVESRLDQLMKLLQTIISPFIKRS